MDVDPLALTLVRAWEVLEPLEIPMAAMGGISLAAWNHPRFTQDIDLLLALPAFITLLELFPQGRLSNLR